MGTCKLTIEIIPGDFRDAYSMRNINYADMVFADPPDNIGLAYSEYRDRVSHKQYRDLLYDTVSIGTALAPHLWVSFNAKWTMLMAEICSSYQQTHDIRPCVQTFTFGQHRKTDLGSNYRPLWRISEFDAKVHPDQIRVPSQRQLSGDKRACPDGRVPGDVFDFPRVVGNSKQRRNWHPTQLHEGLVERCVKLCTLEGDHVIDLFAGTGTTGRVCQRIGRSAALVELDGFYVKKLEEEFNV